MKTKTYPCLLVLLAFLMLLTTSCERGERGVHQFDTAETASAVLNAADSVEEPMITYVEDNAPPQWEGEAAVPEGAVTGIYEVSGMIGRDILLNSGEIVLPADLSFYDNDGSVKNVDQLCVGDVLEVTHNGVLTGSLPAQFGTVYRIVRTTE